MKNKPLPVESWSLWKVVLFPFVLFGIWASLMIFYPNYSPLSFFIGLILTIAGVAGFILASRGQRRKGQIFFTQAFFLILFVTAARAWLMIIGNVALWALWMTLLMGIYLLAWALPSLDPKLSALLWREQYSPETKVGKAVLRFSAKFLPIAGASGALFGMYATRDGQDNLVALFLGIGFSLLSIGLSQVASHTFWKEDQMVERRSGEVE
jgi:hypothetical protein